MARIKNSIYSTSDMGLTFFHFHTDNIHSTKKHVRDYFSIPKTFNSLESWD